MKMKFMMTQKIGEVALKYDHDNKFCRTVRRENGKEDHISQKGSGPADLCLRVKV